MDGHPLRHLDLGRHQQRRPDDRVELEDVLADQVDRRRPEPVGQVLALARVGERRVVVEERVDPDVDHLRLVPRHGHPPLQARAAEREVAQAALDERERLVVAVRGRDQVGALGVQPLERLLEGRQPEEPVVLLLALELDQVDRAAVAVLELGVGLEVGAAGAVPALVGALVDVAVVVDPLDHLGDLRLCSGSVVRMKKSLVALSRAASSLNRTAFRSPSSRGVMPELLGRLGDRLAVLVGAGEEEHVLAALAHVAREHVGGDRRVGVPEVGLAVHVVDRRGDVVGHRPSMLPAAAGAPAGTAAELIALPCDPVRSRPPAASARSPAPAGRRPDGDGSGAARLGRSSEDAGGEGGPRTRAPSRCPGRAASSAGGAVGPGVAEREASSGDGPARSAASRAAAAPGGGECRAARVARVPAPVPAAVLPAGACDRGAGASRGPGAGASAALAAARSRRGAAAAPQGRGAPPRRAARRGGRPRRAARRGRRPRRAARR